MHRNRTVFGDIDYLSVLHIIQKVPAQLVDGHNLAIIPHVGQDDAGRERVDMIRIENSYRCNVEARRIAGSFRP